MKIYELLNALINIAEKGANIARTIRSEETLLELLVQEKKGDQKNDRFLQDFKTLADVLVQELVKYDLSQKVKMNESKVKNEFLWTELLLQQAWGLAYTMITFL